MTEETFRRCLQIARYYVSKGTQVELNLAGIGEPTLHPRFVEFIALAREAVGDIVITFATNGVGYDEELVKAVKTYHPLVWVSLHRPEKAAKARHWWGTHGMLAGVSTDPATNANNWAGQVDWEHTQQSVTPCMWLREGFVMAMSDGRLTACCLDASGAGVIGHVDEAIGSVKTKPYSLCQPCHQVVNIKGFQQGGKR